MYLWYRTLSQHDEFEKAAIPVEYINGDVLLISGIKDQIWRATTCLNKSFQDYIS